VSRDRLQRLEKEARDQKESERRLRAQWELEKGAIGGVTELQKQLEEARLELAHAKANTTGRARPSSSAASCRSWEKRIAGASAGVRFAAGERSRRRGRHRRGRGPVDGDPRQPPHRRRTQKLLRLEEHLHQRVVGQDEAVNRGGRRRDSSAFRLEDPQRPIGSFIFLGPTGVGKTELARALPSFSSTTKRR